MVKKVKKGEKDEKGENGEKEISSRWAADMASDSWLSKNVRPLVLIFSLDLLIK